MANSRYRPRSRRRRVTGRFYLIVFGGLGVLALGIYLIVSGIGRNEIQFGSIETSMEVSAAIIRDEKVVMTEPYEKVSFNVVEGQTINNGDLIAQVYKRGYQDDTAIALLNLQREVYAYQMQLLAGQTPDALADVNNSIVTVEQQIRDTSRKEAQLDMLALEQTLKNLQTERSSVLRSIVTPDGSLNALYSQLDAQVQSQANWKRDIKNESGTGIVSFYFDGYERVLSIDKLGTVNAALVSSVVKGGNTANTTDSTSETPLYRIVGNTHWFLAFVTKSSEPMRLAQGEQYTVMFPDYSEQLYTATARETTVSENSVVNILEFSTDIGSLVGVRTVNATITKSAQGLLVPLNAIDVVSGVPGVNVNVGDLPLRVEVDILGQDNKKAVIRAKNATDTLAAGQKFIKP